MENLVLQRKLSFVHHLANLEEGLAKKVYEIQEKEDSGIFAELKEHMINLNVDSPRGYSKWQWKKTVREYLIKRNRTQILERAKGYKKIKFEEYEKEQFERKAYFSKMDLESVRARFRISNEMVETIRKNYSRKYRNKSLTCPSCCNMNICS